MKLKITLNQIMGAVMMLSKIKELNLGVQVDYWCTKNMKIMSDDYMYFNKKLKEIYAKYCFKGEDGQYCKIIDDNTVFNLKDNCDGEEFSNEMNELLENECEIEPFVMSEKTWNTLPNFKVEGFSSDMIGFLLP